jgi:hypothetical protein
VTPVAVGGASGFDPRDKSLGLHRLGRKPGVQSKSSQLLSSASLLMSRAEE